MEKRNDLDWKKYQNLLKINTSDEERNTYEISPSGYGIHWSLIDEDLSIDGLLEIVHNQAKKRKSAWQIL